MADEPNTKSTSDNDPQPAPPSNTPDEMNEAELEKVRGRAYQAAIDQLFDELLAQTLDVERAALREVQQRLLALGGTEQAAAAAVMTPRLSMSPATSTRTVRSNIRIADHFRFAASMSNRTL